MKTRAFKLDLPESKFAEWTAPKGRELYFTCYYDPCVPIEDTYRNELMKYQHCPPICRRTLDYIDEIVEDIQQHGLRNPILLRRSNDVWTAHPGKCRIAALQKLNIPHFPAVVVDSGKRPAPEGLYQITSPDQFAAHFEGDIVPHFTYRGVRTPKSR